MNCWPGLPCLGWAARLVDPFCDDHDTDPRDFKRSKKPRTRSGAIGEGAGKAGSSQSGPAACSGHALDRSLGRRRGRR